MPVFREALGVEEADLTPGVRLQLQRTIALTGGHPLLLEQLYKALSLSGSCSNPRLLQEILKDWQADWKAIVKFGFYVVTPLVVPSIRRRLAEKSQRAELWSALSEVLLCLEVETDKFKELVGIGLDSDGLPSMINRKTCITAFSKGRLSASAERVVCWGVGRMLVAEEPHLQSLLLGASDSPPAAAPVSGVPPLETRQDPATAFKGRLSALNVGEMEIHMAPASYPAADFYLVNQTKVEVAIQVKLIWKASAITAISKSAHKVKTGSQVLKEQRFVLLVCSDAVTPANIASLTAPSSKDDTEAPVDDVLVAKDLGKVVLRSLMRLTWMDIPTDSENHEAGTDRKEVKRDSRASESEVERRERKGMRSCKELCSLARVRRTAFREDTLGIRNPETKYKLYYRSALLPMDVTTA
eukprot:1481146-Rhodomonas_salina.2